MTTRPAATTRPGRTSRVRSWLKRRSRSDKLRGWACEGLGLMAIRASCCDSQSTDASIRSGLEPPALGGTARFSAMEEVPERTIRVLLPLGRFCSIVCIKVNGPALSAAWRFRLSRDWAISYALSVLAIRLTEVALPEAVPAMLVVEGRKTYFRARSLVIGDWP